MSGEAGEEAGRDGVYVAGCDQEHVCGWWVSVVQCVCARC